MRINSRRWKWILSLGAVALLPVGMTIVVMAAFVPKRPVPAPPRIVAGWASGPMEVHVAFDQPVDPLVAAQAVGRAIHFDAAAVPAAGGTSGGRPGGDGGTLRVAAARLVDDARTLILVTDPHPVETTYTLTLDAIKAPGSVSPGLSRLVAYPLKGVEVTWTATNGTEPAWSGWWPLLDPAAVRVALAGSSAHDRLWPLLKQAGKLTLRTFATVPPGSATVVVKGTTPFEVTLGTESARSDASQQAQFPVNLPAEPVEVTAVVTTLANGPEPTLRWSLIRNETPPGDPIGFPATTLGLAWAPPPLPTPPAAVLPPTFAVGGDPARGAIVFASEQAKCSNCHQIRGVGGQVGPNLSNLALAGRAWVYQNIIEPSAAIHPDFLSYTVALRDGRISMGIVRADGADALRVGDIDAQFTTFPRTEVEELRPSSSSIMPVGLLGALGDDQTRDLLAFLTSQEPAVSPPQGPRATTGTPSAPGSP